MIEDNSAKRGKGIEMDDSHLKGNMFASAAELANKMAKRSEEAEDVDEDTNKEEAKES